MEPYFEVSSSVISRDLNWRRDLLLTSYRIKSSVDVTEQTFSPDFDLKADVLWMTGRVLFKSVGHGGAGGQGDVIQSNPENQRTSEVLRATFRTGKPPTGHSGPFICDISQDLSQEGFGSALQMKYCHLASSGRSN